MPFRPRADVCRAAETGGAGGAHPPARFRLSVLGSFQLLGPAGAIPLRGKLCGLLAVLACSSAPQRREHLATMLWGSHFEPQAQQNMRQALARLRRILGSGALLTSEHAVALARGVIDIDLLRFEALIRDGSRAALRSAFELYREGLLTDVSIREQAWSEWIRAERSRVEALALNALVQLGEMELADEPERAMASGRRAVAIDNLREDAHRVVIRGLVAVGRRAEALRHYDDLAALLKRSLGVEPDQATRALGEALRRNDKAASGQAARSGAASSPAVDEIALRSLLPREPGILVAEAAAGASERQQRAIEEAGRAACRVHQGRLVASRPDQVVLEFPDVRSATAAGFAILQAQAAEVADRHRPIRLGLHVGPQHPGAGALDGSVQVAQQLARVAGPGEIVLSSDARDQITASLDAEIEDLGERPVAAGAQAIRGFRVSHPQPSRASSVPLAGSPIWPTVAVVPFSTYCDDEKNAAIGDILADEIIVALSRSSEVAVISRLSTTALRSRNLSPGQIRALVNATYVLSGTCQVLGTQVRLTIEFTDARTGQVAWAESLTAHVADLLTSAGVVDRLIARMSATIMQVEMHRARAAKPASLEDSTLLMGAIALMHQLSQAKLDLAQEMLEVLVARSPGHAAPLAWLAMVHVLRVSQGWSRDLPVDSQLALDSAERALDAEPGCSLALAVDAHVHTHFFRQFDRAEERFELAVEHGPSNALAWLLKSTLHTFRGEGAPAVQAAETALRLSPLDPRRWYYDSLAAGAAVAAGEYERAIELAQRSIRGNRTHISSFRALTMAQSLAGRMDDARRTAAELMRLQPSLTATYYREQHPTGAFPFGAKLAEALRQAGVPE